MDPTQKPPDGFEAYAAAQRLAEAGRCRCRKCSRELPLDAAVTLNYGGALVFAICPECFWKVDIVLARNENGVRVEMRPRGIVVLG